MQKSNKNLDVKFDEEAEDIRLKAVSRQNVQFGTNLQNKFKQRYDQILSHKIDQDIIGRNMVELRKNFLDIDTTKMIEDKRENDNLER